MWSPIWKHKQDKVRRVDWLIARNERGPLEHNFLGGFETKEKCCENGFEMLDTMQYSTIMENCEREKERELLVNYEKWKRGV